MSMRDRIARALAGVGAIGAGAAAQDQYGGMQ